MTGHDDPDDTAEFADDELADLLAEEYGAAAYSLLLEAIAHESATVSERATLLHGAQLAVAALVTAALQHGTTTPCGTDVPGYVLEAATMGLYDLLTRSS
jgi:hypothetical protein